MKRCYMCYYMSRVTLSCDYCLIQKQLRGCPVENCTKFKPRTDKPIDPRIIEMEALYYQNFSDRAIARKLGVSRYMVYTWRASYGLEPRGESQRGRPRKER